MGLKVSAAVYNHIGRRKNNEDNFYINGLLMEREHMNKGGRFHSVYNEDELIFAVCDGMGGAELGEEASLRAVHALKHYQETCQQIDSTVYLNEMIADASDDVDDISLSNGMESGDSGSTIVMMVLKDWFFRTVHVGDSRVYQLHDGNLSRITKDDSEVQMMVDRGELTLEEAFDHPRKNVITKHLGMPLEDGMRLKPTISPRKDLVPGDRFLICSDGLSDSLRDHEIKRLLMSGHSAEQTALDLVRSALRESERMGVPSDNITVIVLDVLKSGEKNQNSRRILKLRIVLGMLIALGVGLAGGLGYSCYQLAQLLMR